MELKLLTKGKLKGIPEKINMNPMRLKHHKKLVTVNKKFTDDALDEIFNDLIISDDLKDSTILTEQERLYILIWQIVKSKGKFMDVLITCPGCKEKAKKEGKEYEPFPVALDLTNDFKIKPLSDDFKPKKLYLSNNDKIIYTLDIPRRADLKKINEYIKELDDKYKFEFFEKNYPDSDIKNLSKVEESAWQDYKKSEEHKGIVQYDEYLLTIVACISEINNKKASVKDKYNLAMNEMSMRDLGLVSKFREKYMDFGIDFKYEYTCPDCGQRRVTDIPFRPELFSPEVASEVDFENSVIPE